MTFRPEFLARLKEAAKRKQQTVSRFIESEMEPKLEKENKNRIRKMYALLEQSIGIGHTDDPNTSRKIDEILYGDNGAWRGQRDE